ncbi:PD-(D/E)XK nuclease family protein [Paracholeplasma manati]|uniref:PD-(D/E)XK nuclease family protein n=1 Tax=Paracholeplasma manati TaxID=591373 RepID=UPI002407AC93|nr:PD-(D/E)XK nuclease family protein [Paracholeplasma manati]MDG0888300.1 PD-(D/E)XK nuclease family protein [Paracholeplasma manati]
MNQANIFSFAKKELTQDAFLMWLLANHDSNELDVSRMSKRLLRTFTKIHITDQTKLIVNELSSQKWKIDILIDVEIDDNPHLILIEDKVDSIEHSNQLAKYMGKVNEKYHSHQKHFIYYKTNLLFDEERQKVESHGWEVYDIEQIKNLFGENAAAYNHYLLVNYTDHINRLYEKLVGTLPDDITKWDMKHWLNYYNSRTWQYPNCTVEFYNHQNRYYYFAVFAYHQKSKLPYLEIRSRDASWGKFVAYILTYNLEDSETDKQRWIDAINESKLFRTYPNNQRSIARNHQDKEVKNIQEFERLFEKYVTAYVEAFSVIVSK